MKNEFIKHKYTVECMSCRSVKTVNNSGVLENVKKVTVNFCVKCSPSASRSSVVQLCYDSENNRVYK